MMHTGKGAGIGGGPAVAPYQGTTPPVGTVRDEGEERGDKKRRSEGISQESPLNSGGPFTFGDSGKENRNPHS